MKKLRKLTLTALIVVLCVVMSMSVLVVSAQDSATTRTVNAGDFYPVYHNGNFYGTDGYGVIAITRDDIITSYPIGHWTSVFDLPAEGMNDTLAVLSRLYTAPDGLHSGGAERPLSYTPATGDSNLDLVVLTAACVLVAGALLVVYSRKRAQSKG